MLREDNTGATVSVSNGGGGERSAPYEIMWSLQEQRTPPVVDAYLCGAVSPSSAANELPQSRDMMSSQQCPPRPRGWYNIQAQPQFEKENGCKWI